MKGVYQNTCICKVNIAAVDKIKVTQFQTDISDESISL